MNYTLVSTYSFMNWDKNQLTSSSDKQAVFRSLVSMTKSRQPFDEALNRKAVSEFIDSLVPLLSSSSRRIVPTTMDLFETVISCISKTSHLNVIAADFIPQLIVSLSPHSLPFEEADKIHINLLLIIFRSLWLSTRRGLKDLHITDPNEQKAIHETIHDHELVPSRSYLEHLSRLERSRRGTTPRMDRGCQTVENGGFEDIIEQLQQDDNYGETEHDVNWQAALWSRLHGGNMESLN
ncbi:hypothetical protein BLNAU_16918 [Blattamonas nauphoetae]|uniref:Uncharacterized protein n=1 Tax=Blattamonas nauphoetae TaxID=2049346 RepID=A0ABQ9X819_9EUKA|nr:hypothetical protein BLNAU_16918 [Blattamonas nauphoetae]